MVLGADVVVFGFIFFVPLRGVIVLDCGALW